MSKHRRLFFCVCSSAALLLGPRVAEARPEAPRILCEAYADAGACAGRLVGCDTCHTTTAPVAWNPYGSAVLGALEQPFDEGIAAAVASISGLDSDGDGIRNEEELALGSNPGDARDGALICVASDAPGYDIERAYRRVGSLYCGRAPSFEALSAFRALPEAERYGALHQALDACLSSAYWRDEGLARIADPLIRPVYAVGADSPIGLALADYEYDYRLFSYIATGGRDARELLTARYHVERDETGALYPVEGKIADPLGQPLAVERRAGMISTQWFFVINTMFSALPRTTAAQAYRSYLGYDIAYQEGLYPVPNEPADVDRKGVGGEGCVTCHATLDPLSYAFAYYTGIEDTFGVYQTLRPAMLIEDWNDNQSTVLGKPVTDLVEWARVASESDAFAQNLAMIFFRHAFGREPEPAELPELDEMWRGFAAEGHSIDALIHRQVDSVPFGGGAR